MAFKGDDSTLSLATTVTLALAVAAMVFTKNPLQSSRPPSMGTGLHQTTEELKVPARLWEDPFTAVERASDANKQFSVLAIDRRSIELGTVAVSPQSPRITGLDTLHRRIRDIDALGERILTLVVMTQDGSSVEAVENRIRDRYAVAAALEVGCFAPEKDEWLSYFTWNYHIPSRNPANESKLLPQSTPYEWYSRSPIGLCHGSNELFEEIRHVLVLWVKAEEDEATTLTRIDSLLYWIKPSGAMATKLVGPRSSADFRAILKEIERTASSSEGARAHYRWQDDNGTLEFYSPEHGISPTTVFKSKVEIEQQASVLNIRKIETTAYADFEPEMGMVAEPILSKMTSEQLQRAIDDLRKQMQRAAKDTDFLTAAKLRDEMVTMEKLLKEKA